MSCSHVICPSHTLSPADKGFEDFEVNFLENSGYERKFLTLLLIRQGAP